jgi:DNA-binding transcriptional LysR family regulator
LRDRQLDSAIVDIRAMRPANDLVVTHQVEMAASFLCRPGHPLIRSAGKVTFEEVLNYPLASTPLSDEVARVLTERYGPQANPDDCVTLRSDDTQTLIAVARETDAIVLTINAAGKDLHRLEMMPPLNATARFGLVSLNRHAQAPAMAIIGKLLHAVLHD